MVKYLLAGLVAIILFSGSSALDAYVMSSTNYRIQSDSLNIGGKRQTSTNYQIEDTIGDIATDTSDNASFKIKAGYQATWEYPPVLIFSITDNAATLGTITTSSASTDTAGFTVATDAADGYAVTISGNTLTSNSSSVDIDALTIPTASSPGTEQFGLNLVDNSDPDVGSDPSGGSGQAASGYNTANKFKFVSGDTVANCSSSSDTTSFTISYLGNIDSMTVAGDYSTNLTLIATVTF